MIGIERLAETSATLKLDLPLRRSPFHPLPASPVCGMLQLQVLLVLMGCDVFGAACIVASRAAFKVITVKRTRGYENMGAVTLRRGWPPGRVRRHRVPSSFNREQRHEQHRFW